jgi:hypothetical protein
VKNLSRYTLDPKLLGSLLRSYFTILLAFDYACFTSILKRSDFAEAHWLWPVGWLSGFESELQKNIIFGMFVATLMAHALCVLRPDHKLAKLMGFVFFFMMTASTYSFGKIEHATYGFLFASAGFIFVNVGDLNSPREARTKFYFWAVQFSVLGTYLLSGLWKLRAFVDSFPGAFQTNPFYIQVQRNALQNFESLATGSGIGAFAFLATLAWLATLCFEIGCIATVWFPRSQRLVGLAIIALHVGAGCLMDVYFLPAAVLSGLLFCGNPYVERRSSI